MKTKKLSTAPAARALEGIARRLEAAQHVHAARLDDRERGELNTIKSRLIDIVRRLESRC